MKGYYFDNAATSWPKPASVLKEMRRYLLHVGGNPGRSGHWRAVEAARIIHRVRAMLSELFCVKEAERVIFTKNATEALNLVIKGVIRNGDHVICTSMEHNSVMRPLSSLKAHGVRISIVKANVYGTVDPTSVIRELKGDTKLVIVTHASNVTGAINDITAIGKSTRERGIPFLVDAAQTAGVLPIDVEQMGIDFLAFSGHKGLMGPQGTGGLYIGSDALSEPLIRGGTGSLSDIEKQPEFFPDRYESGTPNTVGFAGLGGGIDYIREFGLERVLAHDNNLLQIFLNELLSEKRVVCYGPGRSREQTGVLSINIDGLSSSKVGELLERKYKIQTRIGLHCAPSAHRTIGTFPHGTVRLSWGVFTRERDAVYVARALRKICRDTV